MVYVFLGDVSVPLDALGTLHLTIKAISEAIIGVNITGSNTVPRVVSVITSRELTPEELTAVKQAVRVVLPEAAL